MRFSPRFPQRSLWLLSTVECLHVTPRNLPLKNNYHFHFFRSYISTINFCRCVSFFRIKIACELEESLVLFLFSSGSDRFHSFRHGQNKGGRGPQEVRHGGADCGCARHCSHSPHRSSDYRALWASSAAETKDLNQRWASQTQLVNIFLGYVKSDIRQLQLGSTPPVWPHFVVTFQQWLSLPLRRFTHLIAKIALFTQAKICIASDPLFCFGVSRFKKATWACKLTLHCFIFWYSCLQFSLSLLNFLAWLLFISPRHCSRRWRGQWNTRHLWEYTLTSASTETGHLMRHLKPQLELLFSHQVASLLVWIIVFL